MSPARQTFRELLEELAYLVSQMASLDPHGTDCRQLEQRRLELLDEWFLQQQLCDQVRYKKDSVYQ